MGASRKQSTASTVAETKEKLTAVVLADSFAHGFRPLTAERPKVLIPLVNTPLLDYTLEWLSSNSVEEIFVVCCAHAEQIEDHLKATGWLSSGRIVVHTVVSTNCLSMGDALRLLDHKDIIKTDFVLVTGDVISNMRLKEALDAHAKRRSSDKSSIMTMIMRSDVSLADRMRIGDDVSCTIIDPKTSRLLKYDEVNHPPLSIVNQRKASEKEVASRIEQNGETRDESLVDQDPASDVSSDESEDLETVAELLRNSKFMHAKRKLGVDFSIFDERDAAQVRFDLMDVGIYICAPEVLMLFSDNFDYQNIRRDFVTGVLSEEELGNKLFVHEMKKGYAARVHSFRSYDAISRDVMARWSYPFVPDTNIFRAITRRPTGKTGQDLADGHRHMSGIFTPSEPEPRLSSDQKKAKSSEYVYRSRYRYEQGGIYMDSGAKISRSVSICGPSCIGPSCLLNDDVRLKASVVGSGCYIGKNSIIEGSYLGQNVVIGENAVVQNAFLADGAVVKSGAVVQPNVVLSFGVVVDREMTVPAGSRISLMRPPVYEDSLELDSESDEDGDYPYASSSVTSFGASPRGFGDAITGSSPGKGLEESEVTCALISQPEKAVLAAAAAVARGGIPETTIEFDVDVVGPMGAGFLWRKTSSLKESSKAKSDDRKKDPSGISHEGMLEALAAWQQVFKIEEAGLLDGDVCDVMGADNRTGDALASSHMIIDGGATEPGVMVGLTTGAETKMDAHHFKNEVAETFLRCVKEGISHDNVVIELNGLKIAEDKTFADCARYMLTTALGLTLSAPSTISKEYCGLYPPSNLDVSSREGRLELLKRSAAQLRKWTDLLQKFLRSEEDQVELLLTLEEFCAEEGDFEGTGEHGRAFKTIFPQLLKVLYELDIVSEESFMAWAKEKEHAEEEEKEFLRCAEPFLQWLEEAEEETSSEEEDDSD